VAPLYTVYNVALAHDRNSTATATATAMPPAALALPSGVQALVKRKA
jgi:hypothetical protein